MLKDITIGQYIYGKSALHRMEPGVKILLTLAYAVVVLMLRSPAAYGIYALFTAALIFISGIPFKMMLKGLKPLMWLFVFTTLFNIFLIPGREILSLDLKLFTLSITAEGIITSLYLAVRLILLVMGTSLLTLTTAPLQLTDGIEKLLSPLKVIRVPAHEIAMMMTIAIRFIPTIADEADRVMKAQKARGADMESGGIFRRAKAMIPVIVPLLAGAFRRADDLAVAMDSRCYNGDKRTRMKETRAGVSDAVGAAVLVTVSAAAMAVQWVL